jgi:hypothetical protein
VNPNDGSLTSPIPSPATFDKRRKNLRQLLGIADEPLFYFNREERHLAAVLFHILNHKDNVARVLKSTKRGWEINPEEFGIYFEYSYPRDLWNKLSANAESNDLKREVIIELLCPGAWAVRRHKLTGNARG